MYEQSTTMLHSQNVVGRETLLLDLTRLTNEGFTSIVGPFEKAFQEHIQQWTMTDKPRKERSFSVYTNCPLPVPEDRLLFVLSYLKHAPRQSYHDDTFGLIQSRLSTCLVNNHLRIGACQIFSCEKLYDALVSGEVIQRPK